MVVPRYREDSAGITLALKRGPAERSKAGWYDMAELTLTMRDIGGGTMAQPQPIISVWM